MSSSSKQKVTFISEIYFNENFQKFLLKSERNEVKIIHFLKYFSRGRVHQKYPDQTILLGRENVENFMPKNQNRLSGKHIIDIWNKTQTPTGSKREMKRIIWIELIELFEWTCNAWS